MNKPKSIGRYRLVERVGSGGMGVVYDARDTRTNQRVALKVLLPHAAEANQGLLRFKREFRALARLRHKNIVRVFDAGLEDNVAFIAMEFIQGTNIRAHLEQFAKGKPRFEEIVRCTKAILQALSHIHARRIVHRDLKPENIMVNQNGDVKLMDFGVARVRHNSHEESGLIGTFAYMAPEVVTTSDIDGRSDLYALGVILFELLTDKFPFPVEPPAAALHHHVNTPPQLVRHLEPKAPAELAGLAHALLEKDPIERPRTATDALAWLTDTRSRPTSLPDQSVEMPGLLFVPRFVGRENVLDELQGVASDASAGRGRLIVLEGSNGMGKTRLLTEMRLRIRRRTHVLVGTAHDKAQAYDAIEPILDGIATIASQTQPDVAAKILGPDVGVVRSISPRLASLGSKQDVSHLEGRQRKIRLHKTIIGIIGRLALTRSVVLVVEDIHNVDSLSLELIWDTARTLLTDRPGGVSGETVCPFSIILTYEKSEKTKNAVGVLLRRLKRKKLMERIKLNPLAPDDVSEIISTMTGVKEPSNLLVQQVLQETSGVPGLVQETIHDYVRSQTLVRTRGKWSFNGEPIDAKETDSSVKSFFSNDTTESSVKRVRADLAQFDLTEEAISLLKTIALLGFMVPGSYVTALSETRGDAFFDWMDELVRHGVLVEELDEHSLRYTFSSRTLHSSVLRRLDAAEKTKKHGEIALALESYFWSDRITIAHVLAKHFENSAWPNRSGYYLLKSAEQSALRGDADGALSFITKAVSYYEEQNDTVAGKSRLFRAVVKATNINLAFGRAESALKWAQVNVAEGTRAPLLAASLMRYLRAKAQQALGRFDQALVLLGQLPQPIPDTRLSVDVLRLEAEIWVARCEYVQARANLEAARQIVLRNPSKLLMRALEVEIAFAQLHDGEHQTALTSLKSAIEELKVDDDAKMLARALGGVGLIYSFWDHRAEAISYFREAIELSEVKNLRSEQAFWSGRLGEFLSSIGRREEARRLLMQALEISNENGNQRGVSEWECYLGIDAFNAGDFVETQARLAQALAISRQIGFAVVESLALVYTGAALLEIDFDRLEAAARRIKDGLERALDLKRMDIASQSQIFLARVAEAEGQIRRAEASLQLAREYAEQAGHLGLIEEVEQEWLEITGEKFQQ